MLFSEDGANQATHGWSVREDAHDIGATPYLLVEALQGVVGPDLLAGKVDLNSADAEALMALDGIGETLAQRIAGYRDANGPFSHVDELDEVRGIGPTILSNNRESMVVCP